MSRTDPLAEVRRLKRDGKRADALARVEQVLQRSDAAPDALWLRAWLHAEMGHTQAARADFQRVVQLAPRTTYAAEARKALERLGRMAPQPPARPEPTVRPTPQGTSPRLAANPPPAPVSRPRPSAAASAIPSRPPAAAAPVPAVPAPAPAVRPSTPQLSTADLEGQYLAAEQSLRRRDFAGAAGLLQGVVQAAPGFRDGDACARLMRALLLSQDCSRAIGIAAPLREHWVHNPNARRQMALCRYAVEQAAGLALDCVPQCVAEAFCVPQREYPSEDGDIQRVVSRLQAGDGSDYALARAAFDYIAHHCRYDGGLIGQGRRDVPTVLRSRRGVCTDFARLYVTLCRGAGVPARLVTGECRTGPHAWAQVWIVGKGWMPVDPTRGIRGQPFGRLNSDVRPAAWQRENW